MLARQRLEQGIDSLSDGESLSLPDDAHRTADERTLARLKSQARLLTPAVHRIPHDVLDIIAKVAIFSRVFIAHNASAQELPKVLAAWTAVLKRHGPQEQQLGLTSAELGHKHRMSCCSAERELSDKLRDAEIAESVRKVILARFFSLQDLRTAYASCATLEHQQILCAPLLHAQLQGLSLSKRHPFKCCQSTEPRRAKEPKEQSTPNLLPLNLYWHGVRSCRSQHQEHP